MMTRDAHVKYISRGALQLDQWIFHQLPGEYDVQIDRTQFFKSITYSKDGVRTQVPDWIGGPGYSNESKEEHSNYPYSNKARADAAKEWEEHTNKYNLSIPAVVLGMTTDDNGVLIGGRPSRTKLRSESELSHELCIPLIEYL
jgi:hypothetical protein